MVANPNVLPISSEQRKQFEGMGVEAVRQFCSGNIWPSSPNGYPHPTKVSALIWLAEIDEVERKRNKTLTRSTLIAAWIAAIGTIVGIVVMFALWDHPRR
jgi:hypothetical protein